MANFRASCATFRKTEHTHSTVAHLYQATEIPINTLGLSRLWGACPLNHVKNITRSVSYEVMFLR